LQEIRVRFPRLVELYDNTTSLQDRTAATGVVSAELVSQFGASGYVGRASGRNFDAREAPALLLAARRATQALMGVSFHVGSQCMRPSAFQAAMSQASRALVRAGVFADVVDVGGGNGSLISAVLRANPAMQGTLFDLPHVADAGRRQLEKAGLANRCEVIAGSFLESVPSGGDAYMLKWILHDWNDEQSVAILRNCHRAMGPSGKVLLVESVIPGRNEPFFHKFMDLNMMVMNGGRERTIEEYRQILGTAGFGLGKVIQAPAELAVIEGVRT